MYIKICIESVFDICFLYSGRMCANVDLIDERNASVNYPRMWNTAKSRSMEHNRLTMRRRGMETNQGGRWNVRDINIERESSVSLDLVSSLRSLPGLPELTNHVNVAVPATDGVIFYYAINIKPRCTIREGGRRIVLCIMVDLITAHCVAHVAVNTVHGRDDIWPMSN